MELNFECKKCRKIFDCDVGEITAPENSPRPHFEKNIICPTCGQRTMDEVYLTELGQSQLTEATLDSEDLDGFDFVIDDWETCEFECDCDSEYAGANQCDSDSDSDNDGEGYGTFYEGECQACDTFGPLNDMGLCSDCDAKLDRDLIRERDWAYSTSAYLVPEAEREQFRKKIIDKYGEKLELIAPINSKPKKTKKKNQKKRRHKTKTKKKN